MRDSTADNKERPQCGLFGNALQHANHSAGRLPGLDSVAAASKILARFESERGERGTPLLASTLLGHLREFLA